MVDHSESSAESKGFISLTVSQTVTLTGGLVSRITKRLATKKGCAVVERQGVGCSVPY